MVEQNKKIIEDLINHLKLGKPILNRRRKPIDKATEKKYWVWLKKLDIWLNKPFNDITDQDIDQLRKDLKNDKIRQNNGKPYSDGTKRDIEQKFIKTLLNYLGKYELGFFLTTYKDESEIPSLMKTEVEKLVSQSKLRDKVILQILFDGGFRAEEFLNVKFKDLKDESLKSDGYYKIRITKSKTKPRTVGLTLPLTTEIIKDWLEANKDKIGTNAPFVDLSYRHLNLIIRRIGLNVLKKKITPHQMRHSSATYYCHYLSKYQLCKRYGWSMNSNMPQRYIDREGVEDDSINKKVVGEENASFFKEVNKLKEQVNSKNERIVDMEDRLKKAEDMMNKRSDFYEKYDSVLFDIIRRMPEDKLKNMILDKKAVRELIRLKESA